MWVRQLAGPELRRARERPVRATSADSPTTACICPQFAVEEVLLEATRDLPDADIRYGHRLIGIDHDQDGVTATVHDERRDSSYQIRARYLLGADGSRSAVRELTGVSVSGHGRVARSLSIYFGADLSPYLSGRDLI